MKPFFPYYGSMWNRARYLPSPRYTLVRERFAGGAGYSLFYDCRRVELTDKDPVIAGLWGYLMRVSAAEIMALPELPEVGDNVDHYAIPQEAKWLIGFWLNRGSAQPKKSRTAYSARSDKAQLNWGAKAKERIASQLPILAGWSIREGAYDEGPADECTWLIDPPYVDKGKFYREKFSDHVALGTWCRSLPGQAIVVEGAGARWLPFRSLGEFKTSRGKSEERVWVSGCTAPAPATGFTYYEFFAGGGMARAGLGPQWTCLFANDIDFKKAASYKENWGDGAFLTKDVRKVTAKELPGKPALIWASFPCQDLSLAGMGAGLKGDRSGMFWPFWRLVKKLKAEGRGPSLIVLENVCGTLTSHGGKDFTAIADALAGEGFRFGAVVVDAVEFVPQSRPRLFIVAVAEGVTIPEGLLAADASLLWHPKALQSAHLRLKGKAKDQWLWWKMPAPARRNTRFADLVEENPDSVPWHTAAETGKLLAMMSSKNLEKVTDAKKSGQMLVGTIYKRTRRDDDGKVQRAEIRFDDIAGCLRTSSGGSSRQLIMVVKGDDVRSRLLSSREAARLMGLPDNYKLPKSYNEAYHLVGDGLVVPVVRYLADNLLEPILLSNQTSADVSSHSVSAKH